MRRMKRAVATLLVAVTLLSNEMSAAASVVDSAPIEQNVNVNTTDLTDSGAKDTTSASGNTANETTTQEGDATEDAAAGSTSDATENAAVGSTSDATENAAVGFTSDATEDTAATVTSDTTEGVSPTATSGTAEDTALAATSGTAEDAAAEGTVTGDADSTAARSLTKSLNEAEPQLISDDENNENTGRAVANGDSYGYDANIPAPIIKLVSYGDNRWKYQCSIDFGNDVTLDGDKYTGTGTDGSQYEIYYRVSNGLENVALTATPSSDQKYTGTFLLRGEYTNSGEQPWYWSTTYVTAYAVKTKDDGSKCYGNMTTKAFHIGDMEEGLEAIPTKLDMIETSHNTLKVKCKPGKNLQVTYDTNALQITKIGSYSEEDPYDQYLVTAIGSAGSQGKIQLRYEDETIGVSVPYRIRAAEQVVALPIADKPEGTYTGSQDVTISQNSSELNKAETLHFYYVHNGDVGEPYTSEDAFKLNFTEVNDRSKVINLESTGSSDDYTIYAFSRYTVTTEQGTVVNYDSPIVCWDYHLNAEEEIVAPKPSPTPGTYLAEEGQNQFNVALKIPDEGYRDGDYISYSYDKKNWFYKGKNQTTTVSIPLDFEKEQYVTKTIYVRTRRSSKASEIRQLEYTILSPETGGYLLTPDPEEMSVGETQTFTLYYTGDYEFTLPGSIEEDLDEVLDVYDQSTPENRSAEQATIDPKTFADSRSKELVEDELVGGWAQVDVTAVKSTADLGQNGADGYIYLVATLTRKQQGSEGDLGSETPDESTATVETVYASARITITDDSDVKPPTANSEPGTYNSSELKVTLQDPNKRKDSQDAASGTETFEYNDIYYRVSKRDENGEYQVTTEWSLYQKDAEIPLTRNEEETVAAYLVEAYIEHGNRTLAQDEDNEDVTVEKKEATKYSATSRFYYFLINGDYVLVPEKSSIMVGETQTVSLYYTAEYDHDPWTIPSDSGFYLEEVDTSGSRDENGNVITDPTGVTTYMVRGIFPTEATDYGAKVNIKVYEKPSGEDTSVDEGAKTPKTAFITVVDSLAAPTADKEHGTYNANLLANGTLSVGLHHELEKSESGIKIYYSLTGEEGSYQLYDNSKDLEDQKVKIQRDTTEDHTTKTIYAYAERTYTVQNSAVEDDTTEITKTSETAVFTYTLIDGEYLLIPDHATLRVNGQKTFTAYYTNDYTLASAGDICIAEGYSDYLQITGAPDIATYEAHGTTEDTMEVRQSGRVSFTVTATAAAGDTTKEKEMVQVKLRKKADNTYINPLLTAKITIEDVRYIKPPTAAPSEGIYNVADLADGKLTVTLKNPNPSAQSDGLNENLSYEDEIWYSISQKDGESEYQQYDPESKITIEKEAGDLATSATIRAYIHRKVKNSNAETEDQVVDTYDSEPGTWTYTLMDGELSIAPAELTMQAGDESTLTVIYSGKFPLKVELLNAETDSEKEESKDESSEGGSESKDDGAAKDDSSSSKDDEKNAEETDPAEVITLDTTSYKLEGGVWKLPVKALKNGKVRVRVYEDTSNAQHQQTPKEAFSKITVASDDAVSVPSPKATPKEGTYNVEKLENETLKVQLDIDKTTLPEEIQGQTEAEIEQYLADYEIYYMISASADSEAAENGYQLYYAGEELELPYKEVEEGGGVNDFNVYQISAYVKRKGTVESSEENEGEGASDTGEAEEGVRSETKAFTYYLIRGDMKLVPEEAEISIDEQQKFTLFYTSVMNENEDGSTEQGGGAGQGTDTSDQSSAGEGSQEDGSAAQGTEYQVDTQITWTQSQDPEGNGASDESEGEGASEDAEGSDGSEGSGSTGKIIDWSDGDIMQMSEGMQIITVTGKSEGKVILTATRSDGKTASSKVTVNDSLAPPTAQFGSNMYLLQNIDKDSKAPIPTTGYVDKQKDFRDGEYKKEDQQPYSYSVVEVDGKSEKKHTVAEILTHNTWQTSSTGTDAAQGEGTQGDSEQSGTEGEGAGTSGDGTGTGSGSQGDGSESGTQKEPVQIWYTVGDPTGDKEVPDPKPNEEGSIQFQKDDNERVFLYLGKKTTKDDNGNEKEEDEWYGVRQIKAIAYDPNTKKTSSVASWYYIIVDKPQDEAHLILVPEKQKIQKYHFGFLLAAYIPSISDFTNSENWDKAHPILLKGKEISHFKVKWSFWKSSAWLKAPVLGTTELVTKPLIGFDLVQVGLVFGLSCTKTDYDEKDAVKITTSCTAAVTNDKSKSKKEGKGLVWVYPVYRVTVKNGSGSGTHKIGETVTIAPRSKKDYEDWEGWSGLDQIDRGNITSYTTKDGTVRTKPQQEDTSGGSSGQEQSGSSGSGSGQGSNENNTSWINEEELKYASQIVFTMPAHDITVTANFKTVKFKITSKAGDGGRIHPGGTASVLRGESQTYDFSAGDGYVIESVKVVDRQGGGSGSAGDSASEGTTENYVSQDLSDQFKDQESGSYTFRNVRADGSIEVTFRKKEQTQEQQYHVTVINGSGGGDFAENADVSIVANQKEHYAFKGWKLIQTDNGAAIDSLPDMEGDKTTSQTLSFKMPAMNVTAEAILEPITHTIKATSEGSGTISPSGTVTVNDGDSKSYTMTAKDGWMISSVKVDGNAVSVTNQSSMTYEFTDVTEDHTIHVVFKTYRVKVNSGYGSGNYAAGKTVTIQANEPKSGYEFSGWEVNSDDSGTVQSAIKKGQKKTTFTMPSNDVEVTATYKEKPGEVTHKITASAGEGGTINPSGKVTVKDGKDQSFSMKANEGYDISDIKVDGTSLKDGDSFKTGSFEKDGKTIGTLKVDENGKVQFTFEKVTADHTIRVEFKAQEHQKPTYHVTVIRGNGDGDYEKGVSVQIKADEPAEDEKFIGWKIQGLKKSAVDGDLAEKILRFVGIGARAAAEDTITIDGHEELTFTMPANDVVATAQYEKISYRIKSSAGEGGIIDPAGEVTVAAGKNQSYRMEAGDGYYIQSIKVDGTSLQLTDGTFKTSDETIVGELKMTGNGIADFTFNKVSKNHVIRVEFAMDGEDKPDTPPHDESGEDKPDTPPHDESGEDKPDTPPYNPDGGSYVPPATSTDPAGGSYVPPATSIDPDGGNEVPPAVSTTTPDGGTDVPPGESVTTQQTGTTTSAPDQTHGETTNARTGDDSHLLLSGIVAALSGTAFLVAVLLLMRRRRRR